MILPCCAVILLLAIVFVRFSKKGIEGMESPTCKAAMDAWDMTGKSFTPVCGTTPVVNAKTKCKPYGTEGCIAPFTNGYCPGTLEYMNGKCVDLSKK